MVRCSSEPKTLGLGLPSMTTRSWSFAVVTVSSQGSQAAVIFSQTTQASARRAGKRSVGELVVDLGQQDLALRAVEPVPLLLPGEVADVPGDAVHRRDPPGRVNAGDALEAAPELAVREPELVYERKGHGRILSKSHRDTDRRDTPTQPHPIND